MRFPTLFHFAVLVSLLAAAPRSGYSQSQSTATPQQPDGTSAASSPQQSKASPAAKAKPAKIWTNEEIDTLHNNHGVSVVGNQIPQNVSAKSKPYAQEKDPAWYRKQLTPLRAEIDNLDAQIAKLQAFLNGENVGEQASLHRKIVPSPKEQLKQMEAKRQADAEKMDDLLDRARHNGIEPGALR